MKKLLFLILAFFLSFQQNLSSKNTKFYWSKITTTSNSTFYIDKSSVKKVGPYLYFWTLSNYIIPDKYGTKSVVSFSRVECNSIKSQMLSYTSYFDFFGEGKLQADFIVSNPKWEAATNNSAGYLTLKIVCRD